MPAVTIVGAGAVGLMIAARLLSAGAEVNLVARGATLAALRSNGLTVHELDGRVTHLRPTRVVADPRELAAQDAVIVAVKTQALPALAAALRPLYHPQTDVLYAQNGIPWWYFLADPQQRFAGTSLPSVDPAGTIAAHTELPRVIGGVVYLASAVREPAVVETHGHEKLVLGRPDGRRDAQLARLAAVMQQGGIAVDLSDDIRTAIWTKLWGNLSFNPVSALTRAPMDQLIADPGTNQLLRTMMQESQEVAAALGVTMPVSLDERMRMAALIGAHRTSMLQDVLARRSTELAALLGAVIEMADLCGLPVPALRAVYSLTAMLERINCAGG
jgi:2-dehydropantoate 2-reductase